MLMTIAVIVLVIWLIGLIAHIAAGFINLLLLAAIVLAIAHFLNRGRHSDPYRR